MASRDGNLRVAHLTPQQAMHLGLGIAAAGAAGDAARELGSRLTPENVARVNAAIREATGWMVAMVDDWAAATAEDLEAAARDVGVQVLHAVLGAPASVN